MSTIDYYNNNANKLHKQYLAVSTKQVHQSWLDEINHLNRARILDIGAGNGRDALYLSLQGHHVVAVEPADALKSLGQTLTQGQSVFWVNDSLPELKKVYSLQTKFHVILLSAVWMHIPPSQRERAFRKLSNLLKPGGFLIITLRHGPSPDERSMYPVSVDELAGLSHQFGLNLEKSLHDEDRLKRNEVTWETVILRLPDDGSGAFPTIRNILINDNKAATYKLALIRTLLRIADGHPGAVIRREDNRVILPMGLVSLYWARQYKPLLDQNIQQNSNPSKGLGFVRPEGWEKITHFSPMDFSIGNLFIGDDAKFLHKTLKDISNLIKRMPVKYITLPGTQAQVFEVELYKTSNKVENLFIDFQTLSQYGELALPEKIWDLMTQYACWIEPACLTEWVNVMKDFTLNKTLDKQQLYHLLSWIDAERSTVEVRKRVETLKQVSPVHCVWSNKSIADKYQVDHCLPFARWPNNDLWNMMPANSKVNNQKRDRIPTNAKYEDSREHIIEWWQRAWVDDELNQNRFFTQASLSLPGISSEDKDLQSLFDALKMQSQRVAELQSLHFWQ